MDRRDFLAGASALGLSAIANKAYAADSSLDGKLNVTADFLRDLSSYLNRFAFGTRDPKYVSVEAIEGGNQYSASYGLETETIKDIGHSYKLTRLNKGQPLVVWTRDFGDSSKPVMGRVDTDLDGKVNRLFVLIGNSDTPIDLNEIPQSAKSYNQYEFERGIRALRRKMNV